MNINEIYATESKFLKAEHLPKGKEIEVKINGCSVIELDQKKKLCLEFDGKDKGLVLNKTNASAIAHVYGDNSDSWIGSNIFLYSTKVDYAGQMVDAIRVRVPLESAAPDDDIPF